jgi:hypothetical protein
MGAHETLAGPVRRLRLTPCVVLRLPPCVALKFHNLIVAEFSDSSLV